MAIVGGDGYEEKKWKVLTGEVLWFAMDLIWGRVKPWGKGDLC
jgi:hypothetical protein